MSRSDGSGGLPTAGRLAGMRTGSGCKRLTFLKRITVFLIGTTNLDLVATSFWGSASPAGQSLPLLVPSRLLSACVHPKGNGGCVAFRWPEVRAPLWWPPWKSRILTVFFLLVLTFNPQLRSVRQHLRAGHAQRAQGAAPRCCPSPRRADSQDGQVGERQAGPVRCAFSSIFLSRFDELPVLFLMCLHMDASPSTAFVQKSN